MNRFRHFLDIIAYLLALSILWFAWPFSILRKLAGLHFIHFVAVFILVVILLVHIFWNNERFCNYESAGFLSPTDGEAINVTSIEIEGKKYHKICMVQYAFGTKTLFAPISAAIIQTQMMSAGQKEESLTLIRKVLRRVELSHRSIDITCQNESGEECVIRAFYRVGIPFITADDKVIAGKPISSSNFCILGAIIELLVPVEKSGPVAVLIGQTVIGGETTLIERRRLRNMSAALAKNESDPVNTDADNANANTENTDANLVKSPSTRKK